MHTCYALIVFFFLSKLIYFFKLIAYISGRNLKDASFTELSRINFPWINQSIISFKKNFVFKCVVEL